MFVGKSERVRHMDCLHNPCISTKPFQRFLSYVLHQSTYLRPDSYTATCALCGVCLRVPWLYLSAELQCLNSLFAATLEFVLFFTAKHLSFSRQAFERGQLFVFILLLLISRVLSSSILAFSPWEELNHKDTDLQRAHFNLAKQRLKTFISILGGISIALMGIIYSGLAYVLLSAMLAVLTILLGLIYRTGRNIKAGITLFICATCLFLIQVLAISEALLIVVDCGAFILCFLGIYFVMNCPKGCFRKE